MLKISILRSSTKVIKQTSSARNLGLCFADKLCWNMHVSKICAKVRFGLRRLWMIAWALPTATKLGLVQALVFPNITSCCTVYNNVSRHLFNKLESAFKSCIGFIYGLRKFNRSILSSRLNLDKSD